MERITPSADAVVKLAEVSTCPPTTSSSRRSPDDLLSLLNVVDALVAKSRLRAMAGDLG